MRKVLEGCLRPGVDVLLPAMSDTEPVESFFLVACSDNSGFPVLADHIRRELQNLDSGSLFEPAISATMLLVMSGQSREEQLDNVTARIDRLIQAHLISGKRLN